MFCLWNGEYGEHDLSYVSGLEGILKSQQVTYPNYIGMVVGDFVCLDVEYDWGRRDQRWKIKCNICGKEKYQYHTGDWRRGKGRKTTCECRSERKRQEQENAKKERLEKVEKRKKDHLGAIYGDWKVIEYNGITTCKVECVVCGTIKKSRIDDVVSDNVAPCSHKKPTDYSGDEWIGRRTGHLTVVGRDGGKFIARCDCGREIEERPTILFSRKSKTTCGDSECEYSTKSQREARKKAEKGHEYERNVEKMLQSLGYNAKLTKCYADYGVDVIITENDGTRVAVQCKKQTAPAGVEAVQEVYAGGRFYDCEKFSVVCDKGFSNSAIIMARKLGVYLCDGEYNPPSDIEEYAKELLPIYRRNKKLEKLYEINGVYHTLADWCAIYGISIGTVRKRLIQSISLETALITPVKRNEIYSVQGFMGTKGEICDHFGVSVPFVNYRMEKCGMSLTEAVLTPKKTDGRPKKEPTPTTQNDQASFFSTGKTL